MIFFVGRKAGPFLLGPQSTNITFHYQLFKSPNINNLIKIYLQQYFLFIQYI